MEHSGDQVTILAVPFPAQGHLNQLLHFSLHLSSLGLSVHFACSATHNRQAMARIQGWDANAVDNVLFHDLPMPPFATPPSDPNSVDKFPSQLLPSFEAAMELRAPLASLFRSLSATSRRLVVVHDPLMSFPCSDVDEIPNAESYRFRCVPVFYQLSFLTDQLQDQLDELKPGVKDVILTPLEDCFTKEFWDFVHRYYTDLASNAGIVANTCRAIDGEFIDLLAHTPKFREKRIFAVGPLNPIDIGSKSEMDERPQCLQWLDEQPAASVVYVSFGSTTSISDEQIEQLATGLERSGQRFLWVLKDADRGDVFNADGDNRRKELPPGFEERHRGFGLVVRGWAPQLEIMAHASTGAFVSHCGWNSCMESLSMGVPIIAWPMHSDQPRNAMLVADYLKAGVVVREWARHKELVSSAEIENSIRRLMLQGGGEEIRKRARALGEEIRHAVSDKGSSRTDLDSFVAHITK